MPQTLLTPREVADRLRVSARTVYLWIDQGRLPSVRLSERCTRVPSEAVDGLVRQGTRTLRPDLTSVLWDVDPERVDEEKHAKLIIARILDAGTPVQYAWMRRRYGPEQIAEVIEGYRGLSPKAAVAWRNILGSA